ncbi:MULTISPECIES: hypothetical protein [Limnospira]|uniref:hypothetical protein n=1 Tax=Limnospira TaxID=2596745 RepID=UPI000AFC27DC|nr:hypothetical protein [Limnospira sp. PMC 1223.20]MDC0837062.1 hypothetical protein [Limnoraphis robusta]MDT9267677.1 hypothetical protein [Limnospira sp. PMC 1223.20]QJB25240.1 hypothetical protein HFV01_04790 [Limnospira fusiformis SAG 85.79]
MVQDYPDGTVRQYREHLLNELDVYVSVGGMCEFLKKEELTLKKNYRSEKVATEEGQQQRFDYRERVRCTSKMIFIDDTAFWVGMIPSIARSKKGKKHDV